MHEPAIKKSLRFSLLDGLFASIMFGISETFIVPYAIAMKASVRQIAVLSSLPGLVGALLQVKSASIVERLGSRKELINSSVLIHALMWLPIIALPYLMSGGAGAQPILLIIFYTLFIAAGSLALPAWSSLMADHVPETERGRVFGWRNRVFGAIHVLSMFSAGLVLYLSKRFGLHGFLGFTGIFIIAFISRLISWNFLTRMYE